jgi:hypothetical protein
MEKLTTLGVLAESENMYFRIKLRSIITLANLFRTQLLHTLFIHKYFEVNRSIDVLYKIINI